MINPSTLLLLTKMVSLAAAKIFLLALLLWNILRFYPGDRWLVVRLGNYLSPWFFMGLIPILVTALLSRRRWLAVSTLMILLLFVNRHWYLFTPQPKLVSAESHVSELRVMTFNVHYTNRNAESIAGMIQAENPDVIALQELTEDLATLLLPTLASDYPYYLVDNSHQSAPAFISRYPLQTQPKPPTIWRAQQIIIETPSKEIIIWNVHPKPGLKPSGWKIQTETFTTLAGEIEQENRPLIVLGDFNTIDQTENYQLIANHLTDVHHAVGRGFGFTYPEAILLRAFPMKAKSAFLIRPAFRIDYIFINQHFTPLNIHSVSGQFHSDHRPVVATLRFNP